MLVQNSELLPVLSVVGGSGVGKSTFMRLCVKEGHPKPFAAPSQSTTSTSADIHAYIGCLSTEKQLDVLMLDSEGKQKDNESITNLYTHFNLY
jgi:hypothetical protein